MSRSASQKILVVDPDSDFLGWAEKHLTTPSVEVICAESGEKALQHLVVDKPDLILAESALPDLVGLDLLKQIRLSDPTAMVVLTTGFPATNTIIEAMKYGAYDFLSKAGLAYDLRPVVENALRVKEGLDASGDKGNEQESAVTNHLLKENIIGSSSVMQEVFKMIGRVSRSDAPVMITGESGTGKEVVAKAIHQFSPRSANEFVAINCAAIPANLLESELFGHEKGAFTGAVERRIGRFEQCTKGTLFLDEIGDMPLEVQSKLLRVLQEGQFSRVGGNDSLDTGARILAATNHRLEEDVSCGQFREDLFYRLNVVRIHMPPLRQRLEDIPLLANFFLARIAPRHPRFRFAPETLDAMVAYRWPGNVRELENTIQRAVVLARSPLLMPEDIPLGEIIQIGSPEVGQMESGDILDTLFEKGRARQEPVLAWLEREMIKRAFEFTGENQAQAARILGITRTTLKKRLQDHGHLPG